MLTFQDQLKRSFKEAIESVSSWLRFLSSPAAEHLGWFWDTEAERVR